MGGKRESGSESTAAMMQALVQYLPALTQTVAEQTPVAEQARVDTMRDIAPQVADIQTQLLQAFGVPLAEAGAAVDTASGRARATGEAEILRGQGPELAEATRALQGILDPEFYTAREKLGADINRLNLDTALSGAELEQIRRGQAQTQAGRGQLGAPTPTSAIESAVNFGDAVTQKKLAISNAIQGLTQSLPMLRTGIDPTQLALGRSSTGQAMASSLPGVQQPNIGAQTSGAASNLLNQAGQNQRAAMSANAQRDTIMDRIGQGVGIAGQLFG